MVLEDDYNIQPRRVTGSNAVQRSGVSEVAAGFSRLASSYKHRLDDDDASSQLSSASKTRRGYYTVIFSLFIIFEINRLRLLFLSILSLATDILIGNTSRASTLSLRNRVPNISALSLIKGSLS